MKIYTNEVGHMTNMAAMPIHDENLKKSSSPEAIDPWPWNLVCSVVYASITKVVFSSPEHEVLMVSYCDQSMSVVRRQQFVLKANSSWTLRPVWFKLHRNVA